eukprot:766953-Hanusia_phi.AAC.2
MKKEPLDEIRTEVDEIERQGGKLDGSRSDRLVGVRIVPTFKLSFPTLNDVSTPGTWRLQRRGASVGCCECLSSSR